ncbi:hypothetical protein LJC46_08735 [Desulfovibrio sp. OttesenSCG-928-G15]|nr:hypothetical protein [Desulfovibrio sp. OttesenSCG-928-G15]
MNQGTILTLPTTGFLRLNDVLKFIPLKKTAWYEGVKALAYQGRRFNEFLSFGEKVTLTEAAGLCVDSMNDLAGEAYLTEKDRASFAGKARGLFRGLASNLTALRYVFDALDGYKNIGGKNTKTGPNHDFVVVPLQNALGQERRMLREFEKKVGAALAPLYRDGMKKGFAIDGVPLPDDVRRDWGGLFTHEKVVATALNMGNEGNMKALMRGYGWTEADLAKITSGLTVAEWRGIQGIWDVINELYPELDATHRKIHGVGLGKVAAQPITIQAADGVVTLPGGYYPLQFDHRFSRKAAEQQNADELINRNEALQRSAKPKSGFTKDRQGGTLPPKLGLSVIHTHIVDSIHYATHAPALRDVYRLAQLPEYRDAFIRAAGLETYNELTPWLRSIARPEGAQITKFGKVAEWMAKRGTLFVLGLNMKSAFLQLSSVGNSIQEVGSAAFVKGVYRMLTRTSDTYDAVREKSAYMESRARMFDASLRENLDKFSPERASGVSFLGKRFTLEQVQNAQFAIIQALDSAVAYPTWVAAYDNAIASGMADADAVNRADEAVIRAQGSGGSMDIPAVMRERGVMKLSTTFMTFALNDYNRKRYFVAGFREKLRGGASDVDFKTFAQHLALEWVAPVVFTTLMLSLGRDGELPEAEDFAWEAAGFLSMGIPFARDAVRLAELRSTGKGYGSRMGGSVGFAGIESAWNVIEYTYKAVDEDDEEAAARASKELFNTMMFSLGLGSPQLWRTIYGSEAYFVDDEGGPLAPVLGKPKKK